MRTRRRPSTSQHIQHHSAVRAAIVGPASPRKSRRRLMFRRQLLRLGAASLSLGVASASVSLASCQELKLPPVGLGLWKSSPGEVHAAVRSALRAGYTLLDGAAAYGNEKEVGAALAAAIADGDVRREDVWVVSSSSTRTTCGRRPHAAARRPRQDARRARRREARPLLDALAVCLPPNRPEGNRRAAAGGRHAKPAARDGDGVPRHVGRDDQDEGGGPRRPPRRVQLHGRAAA